MIEIAASVLALVNIGGVDEALFDRVKGHLEAMLHTTPIVLDAREAITEDGLDAEADALAAFVTDDVLAVVALTALEDDSKIHGKLYPVRKVAFVNVTGLKPEDPEVSSYERRVEKESIRAAGLALGMRPCPMPLCALFSYADDQGLDNKGRNYCPPCQRAFSIRAKEIGLTLTEEPRAALRGEE